MTPSDFSGLVLPFNVESKNGRVYTSIDKVADYLMVTLTPDPSITVNLNDVVGVVDNYEIKEDGLYISGHFSDTPKYRVLKHFLDADLLTFVPNGVGTGVDGFVKDYHLTSINIVDANHAAFNNKVEVK